MAVNATQVHKVGGEVGVEVWEERPARGPFGFNEALQLDGKECVADGDFRFKTDDCVVNPSQCSEGLSFSIWEKVTHPRKLIDLDPDTDKFEKKYIFSTGADFDYDLEKSIPGIALYHEGLDLVAIVSTGVDVWELKVRGQLVNKTWTSIGIMWEKPNLDESVTLKPEKRGGLEMYINLEKVGHAVLPIRRAGYVEEDVANNITEVWGMWDVMDPLKIPKKDYITGKEIVGEYEEAPVMLFGCHYDVMEEGMEISPGKFDHFHEATLDEMAIWTRKLQVNKTHDESLYFLGGYNVELEEMTPAKFAEILKSVDMEDPDQALAAGSMTSKLLTNSNDDSRNVAATTAKSLGSGGASAGQAQLQGEEEVVELTWKEKEKNKQLMLLSMYKELLSTSGVRPDALPKHLDSRFYNLPVAAKLLSCDRENQVRWKIVQEDEDQPGSSEIIRVMEQYAMAFMGSANISFYDHTEFFNATTSEYIANLAADEMFMSVQKMNMRNLRIRGPVFDTHIYQQPTKVWDQARALWDNPYDEIRIPTEMWTESALCSDNPVSLMYAIYPCYSSFAPLRRNPVEVTSQKFVLDSKVISVRMVVNNDTFDPQRGEANLCKTDPQWMKYHPVQVRFYHKSKETARRKILHHEDEIKTSIDIRRCVIWNDEIGLNGAWDAVGCTTVMTDQDNTLCECDRFGTYALAAEKIEQPFAKDAFTWLVVSRYIGFVVSLISLTIFIVVICVSKHLWEMFHLMRLNTGICYWCALLFHFISEAKAIQEDRHSNAAISSLILFFYLSGSYFQLMEAFAEFRAITGGIIGGKTMAYIPIGWGAGFLGLGLTWFLYGNDIGTDPDVFIGWENETKMPFFYMNWVALWTGLVFSAVVLFNASTPQTRKEDVVEDLQVQGQGLAITNFFFCMVWVFAYPAYIKFPGREMQDFYPVFTLFNAWMGFIIFIFLGLSSKRFRFVLSEWWRKAKQAKWKSAKKKYEAKSPVIPVSPLAPSRPLSARTTISQVSEDSPAFAIDLDEDPVDLESGPNEGDNTVYSLEHDDGKDDIDNIPENVESSAEVSNVMEDDMDDDMEDEMDDDMEDEMDDDMEDEMDDAPNEDDMDEDMEDDMDNTPEEKDASGEAEDDMEDEMD